MERKRLPEERLATIYQKAQQTKTVTVNELAAYMQVSKSTVRNDLATLEARGLVKRTHGGAMLSQSAPTDTERFAPAHLPLEQRLTEREAEKDAIGALAATLVEPGDTLMIDGGSTTQYVARHLAGHNGLTVITNSFYMMQTLMRMRDAVVYLAGGIVYRDSAIVVGESANEFLRRFKVKKAIIGIDGLSAAEGLTDADAQEPAVLSIKQCMIEACAELIIVCDHTKIGKVCLAPVAPLSRVSVVVTDSGADANQLQALQEKGIRVLVAPTGKDTAAR